MKFQKNDKWERDCQKLGVKQQRQRGGETVETKRERNSRDNEGSLVSINCQEINRNLTLMIRDIPNSKFPLAQ